MDAMHCPRCGQANPDGARFCLHCGASLVAGETAREERKVVSVVFVDLVGFTATAERLDPEDVRALLAPYHAALRADLERYGGSMEKFIGDAVMAVFGAPHAHEDDAERAVRAALAIRDRIAGEGRLQVRVGITTGEALVSLDARPELGEGMVAGDVVNTASRIQAVAAPDSILVDDATYRATRRAIDFRDVEPVTVKGKRDALILHEALAARSRVGVDLEPGAGLPLIGRSREIDLLVHTLDRTIGEREPQLVTIVGVPGIGKSRLVAELFRSIEAGDRLVAWRRGRSFAYAQAVSYWALGEIVKADAGILDSDDALAAERRIRAAVEALELEPDEQARMTAALRPLVGLERLADREADLRGEAFEAWRHYLEALAARRPLVLVFEDLHWADDGLLDFIDHLAEWASGVPLLIVTTARPELLTRRPGWGGGKPNAVTLSVGPLSDAESGRLVASLVERGVIPDRVREQVLERAQGNPLYAEEFARLVAGGGDVSSVPEGVRGLIGARIDLLERDEKSILQDAAVVGRVFWSGAVAAMGGLDVVDVEEILHRLERREFVRRERRSTVEGDSEFAFRHVLIRDVAYGQIPRGRRAEKHLRAAAWIEALGRAEDRAEQLAQHYLAALELARAAQGGLSPDAASRARIALVDGGDRAASLNAFRNAARLYAAALELVPPGEEPEPDLLLRHGRALRISDEAGDELLARAEQSFTRAGANDRAAEAASLLAELAWYRADLDGMREHLDRTAALLADAPESRSSAYALSQVARYQMLSGHLPEAVESARRALEISERLGLTDVRVSALINLGMARFHLDPETGLAEVEEATAIARRERLLELPRALNNLSVALEVIDLSRTAPLIQEAYEQARLLGNVAMERFIATQRSWWPFDTGRWDDFLEISDPYLAGLEEGGHTFAMSEYSRRAEVHFGRDDSAAAHADLGRALDLAHDAGKGISTSYRPFLAAAWIAARESRLKSRSGVPR